MTPLVNMLHASRRAEVLASMQTHDKNGAIAV